MNYSVTLLKFCLDPFLFSVLRVCYVLFDISPRLCSGLFFDASYFLFVLIYLLKYI